MWIVYYHNVVEGVVSEVDRRSSRLERDKFARQMQFLHDNYRVISLDEQVDRIRSGREEANCLSVTFDDAYSGVDEVAVPILAELGMPAAMFAISSGFRKLPFVAPVTSAKLTLTVPDPPPSLSDPDRSSTADLAAKFESSPIVSPVIVIV